SELPFRAKDVLFGIQFGGGPRVALRCLKNSIRRVHRHQKLAQFRHPLRLFHLRDEIRMPPEIVVAEPALGRPGELEGGVIRSEFDGEIGVHGSRNGLSLALESSERYVYAMTA